MSPVDPSLQRTLADNVWLHFFQMGHSSSTSARPTVLVRGEGSRVWDQDGNAYIDALAGLFCVNVGYGGRPNAGYLVRFPLLLPQPAADQAGRRAGKDQPDGFANAQLLRHWWLRGGRDRAQACKSVSAQAWLWRSPQDDLAPGGLSRHYHGRAFGEWADRRAQWL